MPGSVKCLSELVEWGVTQWEIRDGEQGRKRKVEWEGWDVVEEIRGDLESTRNCAEFICPWLSIIVPSHSIEGANINSHRNGF